MSKVKRRMRHELDETTKEYKHQLADMEVTIQDLYVKEQDIKQQHSQWTEKEEKYAAVLELWKEKYDKLRRRTALQMEGYQNEAMQLRKYLQKLEKQYYQHKQQGVTGVRATQAKSP